MLSAAKAKLKSALESTNNQIAKDMVLNRKLAHRRGVPINFKINLNTLGIVMGELIVRELTADLRNN